MPWYTHNTLVIGDAGFLCLSFKVALTTVNHKLSEWHNVRFRTIIYVPSWMSFVVKNNDLLTKIVILKYWNVMCINVHTNPTQCMH